MFYQFANDIWNSSVILYIAVNPVKRIKFWLINTFWTTEIVLATIKKVPPVLAEVSHLISVQTNDWQGKDFCKTAPCCRLVLVAI